MIRIQRIRVFNLGAYLWIIEGGEQRKKDLIDDVSVKKFELGEMNGGSIPMTQSEFGTCTHRASLCAVSMVNLIVPR